MDDRIQLTQIGEALQLFDQSKQSLSSDIRAVLKDNVGNWDKEWENENQQFVNKCKFNERNVTICEASVEHREILYETKSYGPCKISEMAFNPYTGTVVQQFRSS